MSAVDASKSETICEAVSPALSDPNIDEVVALARRIWAADDRSNDCSAARIDADRANDHSAASYYKAAENEAVDEYFALQATMPFVKATTLTGAALHISEAMNIADAIRDSMNENEVSAQLDRRFRAIDRLLWSAVTVVDALASLKMVDVHRNAITPCLNPWTPVEQRLEMVRAAR